MIEEVRELKRWAEEKRVWTQGRGKIKGTTVMFKQKKNQINYFAESLICE